MKLGKQTIKFESLPSICSTGSVVGPKENKGPLAKYFDKSIDDVYFGEKTFEKAEIKLMQEAIKLAISKEQIVPENIDYILAGDLLNQCISSGYAMREFNTPFFGLYGACSTFVESNILASVLVDSGNAKYAVGGASSHFCSAEKQFRLPLEQGSQAPPTSQWTVTGAGASLISNLPHYSCYPRITHATVGKVIDMGINDIANMGAAMAPAAFDTIVAHFEDTGRTPDYYDAIITGDLGMLGSEILKEQLKKYGYDIDLKHKDCGNLIFDNTSQDTRSGGSGCGCCATVFSGYFYSELINEKANKILLVATGALMSPLTLGQGETIPGIAHAIAIENL